MNREAFLKNISPFVYSIELDEKYYLLFNFSNLSVVKIEKDVLREIKDYLERRKNELSENSKRILEELEKRGFVIELPIKDISEYKKQMLEYSFQKSKWQAQQLSLWIHITSRCNFACPYCYLVTKPGRDMELRSALAIVNFVKNRFQENPKIRGLSVAYSGGEPLLRFDMIQMLHESFIKLARDLGTHYDCIIITNGSLLSSEIIERLNTYSVKPAIQVTIDGTEETHNRSRPFSDRGGSFHEVYTNFLNLVKNYRGDIALRSNINYDNVESVRRLLHKLKEDLGVLVNRVSVSFAWIVGKITECSAPFILTRDKAEILLSLYELAATLGFNVSPQLLMLKGPCMPVYSESYVIDESLKVYKCPDLVYTDEYFGYLEADGELRIVKDYNLVRFLGEPVKCYLTCEYGPLCFGGCRTYRTCYINWFKTIISPRFIDIVRARKHATSQAG